LCALRGIWGVYRDFGILHKRQQISINLHKGTFSSIFSSKLMNQSGGQHGRLRLERACANAGIHGYLKAS
jgi:hypothetical protein